MTDSYGQHLKYFVAFACTACFLAMSWDQLVDFLSRQTNVSKEWKGVETRKLPLVVFCPKDPFLETENLDMYTLRLDPDMFEVYQPKLALFDEF